MKQDISIKVEEITQQHLTTVEAGAFFRCTGDGDKRNLGLFLKLDDEGYFDPPANKIVGSTEDHGSGFYQVWSFKQKAVVVMVRHTAVEIAREANVYCLF